MSRRDIPALTGLRGIAVLLVLLDHFAGLSTPWSWSTVPRWFGWMFAVSHYGMTLFFTLSGFVIAYNYAGLDWRGSPMRSAVTFAAHRIFRLYPALLLFLYIRTPGGAPNWPSTTIHALSIDTWAPFKIGGTLPMGDIHYNITWSISTEFGLYLMFGIAMLIFSSLRSRTARGLMLALFAAYVALVLGLVLSSQTFSQLTANLPVPSEPLTDAEWQTWAFYLSPYFHVIEFALGAAAAWAVMHLPGEVSRWRNILRIAAASSVPLLLLLHVNHYWPLLGVRTHIAILETLSALLFATIMLNAADTTRLNRALSNPRLLFIGTISYSLYLFQYAATALVSNPGTAPFDLSLLPRFIVTFCLCLLFAMATAYGLYHLVEAPSRRWLRALLDRYYPYRATAPVAPLNAQPQPAE